MKNRFIITGFLLLIFVSSFSYTNFSETESLNKNFKTNISNYILINGNSQFSNYATSGDGSKAHPYVISNRQITSCSLADNITVIQNTDKYFLLQNINASCNGDIFFINVQNGNIENLLSSTTVSGIYISSSSNMNITSSTVIGSWEAGINIYKSQNLTLSTNVVQSSHWDD